MFAVQLKFYIMYVLPVAVGAVWSEKVHEGFALILVNQTQSCILFGVFKEEIWIFCYPSHHSKSINPKPQ